MMDDSQRAAMIRKGNQAFNEGDMELAANLFKSTEYKDGLIRMGDYYYFNLRQPLMAYGYYRRANHTIMLDRLSENFINALKFWLNDGSSSSTSSENGEDNPQKSPAAEQ